MAAAVESAPDMSDALSDEEEFADTAPAVEVEEEEEEVGTPGNVEAEDDLGDDLFGDDDEEADQQPEQRKLDDEELDSGDDEGRVDRAGRDDLPTEDQVYNFMDADIARHAVPEPSDGELYLLKVPDFMALEPIAFNHRTFQPPTTDHHSKKAASDHFSAFNTAMTTIRWRRSPSDHSKLQSNARILRWSDGSLTLQHANDPLNQYEINASMLAPPQVDPKVPTPTMIKGKRKENQNKESYTYLVAPYEEANVIRVTNKLTTSLSVVATANTKDQALEKLQNDLAAAASRGRDSADQAISFIDVNEDPELRRQREELQYKEKLKQQRAREKHALKEQERNSRVMGKSSRGGYGLDIDDLEGGASGKRAGAKKPRAQARRHRDWSEDEDYGRRGANKEDDYDESDDFIARSDEEPEVVDDDEDEDDGIMEEPRARKEKHTHSPKRSRGHDHDADDDEDVVVRSKKRRVVVDEDEDDE